VDDTGRPLTTTADVEDHIVLLRVQPLHDLGGQLGHKRGRVLVGLLPVSNLSKCLPMERWLKSLLASEDQLSFCSDAMLFVWGSQYGTIPAQFCVCTRSDWYLGVSCPLYTLPNAQRAHITRRCKHS
jgi:hypothetical protein